MTPDDICRRRFLRLGTLGLATSIAGCNAPIPGVSGTPEPRTPLDPEQRDNFKDTDPDGTPQSHPPDSPANFRTPSTNYNLQDLPQQTNTPTPLVSSVFDDADLEHPDNRIFDITVPDGTTANVTLEHTQVTRDITLTLHVRDENGTFQTTTQPLSAIDGGHQTRELEFDISDISLPTDSGSFCELTARDTHEDASYDYIIKRHQFVAIKHKNGIYCMNSDTFNTDRYRTGENRYIRDAPRGVTRSDELVSTNTEPAGAMEAIDTDNERIVFLAVRNTVNGEIYGVSAHVDQDAYNQFNRGSLQYKQTHDIEYECNYATEISHLQELGTKTAEAITDIGITGSRERLTALGDLIQMIPYTADPNMNNPPTRVLYETTGDCTGKSGLFASIVQNDPWNQIHAFIQCKVSGELHITVGINTNTLNGDYDSNSDFIIQPTQEQINNGFAETGYLFYDMTYDSEIGQRQGSIKDEHIHDNTKFTYKEHNTTSNDTPNY